MRMNAFAAELQAYYKKKLLSERIEKGGNVKKLKQLTNVVKRV